MVAFIKGRLKMCFNHHQEHSSKLPPSRYKLAWLSQLPVFLWAACIKQYSLEKAFMKNLEIWNNKIFFTCVVLVSSSQASALRAVFKSQGCVNNEVKKNPKPSRTGGGVQSSYMARLSALKILKWKVQYVLTNKLTPRTLICWNILKSMYMLCDLIISTRETALTLDLTICSYV